MPNRIHGILEIRHDNVETQHFASPEKRKTLDLKETQDIASLRWKIYKNQFGPQSNNLSSIIRGFKIGVIKFARQDNVPFTWQERFFDHVIRNEKSLFKIRSYILENPAKWERDRNNPANLLM
jgi:putative transposase